MSADMEFVKDKPELESPPTTDQERRKINNFTRFGGCVIGLILCSIATMVMLGILGLGIWGVRCAWMFLKWCWNHPIAF